MARMDRVDVFISSAMNELEYDREIVCEMVDSISLNSTMFEMFPSMSESPSEAYLEKVRNCNIFILILWKSFTNAVNSEYEEAIHKNKPVLIFLKNLKDGETRSSELISFIKSIESAKFKATIYKQYRTVDQLRQEAKKAISNEIAKNYEAPRISQTREEWYELGGSIISQSYNRVFIYEKTPCLFLGGRDYLSSDDKKVTYEHKVVSILSEWIEKNINKNHTEFMSLFSIEKTKAELIPLRGHKYYIENVRSNILKYKQYEEDTGFRFRFLPVQLAISGWMLVGDIYYAMWFIGESTALSQKNEKISNEIVNQLKRSHDMRMSADELLSALDL